MNRRIILIVTLLVLFTVVGSGFSTPKNTQSSGKEKSLHVAVLAPLSGPGASGGDSSRKGFEMALEELQAKGAELSIEYLDTQGSPKVAVGIYQQLMVRKSLPDVIIPEMSGVTQALKPLLKGKNLAVATGVSNESLSDPSDSTKLFRIFLSANSVGTKAAEFVAQTGVKKAAVVYVDDEYGRVTMEAFKKQFSIPSDNTTLDTPFGIMDKDFRNSWARILAENPYAVFICGYGPGYLTVLNQLREVDYKGVIVTDWSLTDPGYMKATGGVRNGTKVVTVGWSSQFEKAYRERYNQEGSFVVAGYSHATLCLIWAAYSSSDGTPKEMARALLALKDFKSVMGPIEILPNGGVTATCDILTVEDMKLRSIE